MPTHWMVFVLCFKGISMTLYLSLYDSRWHGQLMGWLASLTPEDKAR